jgi:nucleoside-diphosphate-sugar epimerase
MKAIILGHTSMLGIAVKQKLAEHGHQYITAGRSAVSSIHVDLRTQPPNETHFKDYKDIDCIFVLPSSFSNDSIEGLTENVLVNTAGCTHVISLARATSAKSVIYAGSVSSYKEFDINRGLSSYGLSKMMAEEVLDWWSANHAVRFASIRFSQLYDDYGLCIRHQPWIGRIIRYGFEKQDLYMPASASKRNFLHVEDAAELMIEASLNASAQGILNGCSPLNESYQDIADIVFYYNRCIDRLHVANSKEPFKPLSIPADILFYQMIGRKPLISLENWVERIDSMQTWQNFGPMDVEKP